MPTVPTQGSTSKRLFHKLALAETEYPLACSQALLLLFSLLFQLDPALTGCLAMIFMTIQNTNIAVGKYLVSPLAKPQGQGLFAASVSIRSGRGSATHDRVLRFSTLFDSAAGAVHYATEHALGWIKERSAPVCA